MYVRLQKTLSSAHHFRKLRDDSPKLRDRLYDCFHHLSARGFSDIAVRVAVVSIMDILLGIRRREYQNGDPAEVLVFFDSPQYFVPAYPRQIPIQKNNVGQGSPIVFFIEQYLERLLAVDCNIDLPREIPAVALKRTSDQV